MREHPSKESLTHIASFHNARFITQDLPNKPIESCTSYTQRGGAYTIEVAEPVSRMKSVTGSVQKRGGGHCLQARQLGWQHMSRGVEFRQDFEYDPWYCQAPVLGVKGHGVLTALKGWRLQFILVSVQMEFLSKCPACGLGHSGPS